ncbi:MAG TPA: 4Fe-4S ferredoxin [Phycisphaerales bacterium]|nr:4Fe-4S ferredoxin [Phycisphaerales bacterium]
MTRFETMSHLMKQKKLFKLVCGAGNEDAEQVKKLVFVYTLAGAKCFDVSANIEVVKSAVAGIDKAFDYAVNIDKKIEIRPFINVSIGMRGDPHVRKAAITDKCIRCGACIDKCPTDAIKDSDVITEKCIGCGNCESACDHGAIKFYHNDKDLKALLLECKESGAEQFELHAAVPDSESIFSEWAMINEIITDNYVSMCLDRLHLSDFKLEERIIKAKEISQDRLIIQADGVPMSGGCDDFNTTLQAVAIADIIVKRKLDTKILLSGGTNSLTTKLADMCGVEYNGVSIGTFARNLVKNVIGDDDFMDNDDKILNSVGIAEKLIIANIGEQIW